MRKEDSKVLILTEGGKDIGLGHITRCISLCQALGERNIIPELIINGKGEVSDLLKNWKFRIFDWIKLKDKAFKIIAESDIVICDSFLADISFYESLSNLVKTPVYIDDNKRLDYPRGTVVNVSIYSEEFDYPEKEGITYLLGTKYTILRKEFWNIPEKKIKSDVESIMVTFGGDDRENITPGIMKFLKEKYGEYTKNIVVGRGFGCKRTIEGLKDEKTNLIYDPGAEEMKKVMLESDIAVSAGGQTLYELARIGVPVVGVAAAENQLKNLYGWKRAGFLEYAGKHNDKDIFENISHAFGNILPYLERLKRSKIGRDTIDGKGAARLCRFLLEKPEDKWEFTKRRRVKIENN
ncbi:MAG: UDP-2,4-diacetamido-2,4,6-trideoxy-beta-L-altropyranose hydrolase [Candidatus Omnitrophota bacterium]|nr:MAG: UDP-2,4-diacetamido-2,4,6-trideoxy-beta-L-altropyranose hydrolase [Candidatus Omnitrophota bacterium]